MVSPLEDFFEIAKAFCLWSESPPGKPDDEVSTALQFVSRLYSLAFQLPSDFHENEALSIPHEKWQIVFERFDSLPFNYYKTVVDPFELEREDICLGDVADDLADIWRDIKPGILLYESGNREAAGYEWRESFNIHWGQHAANAIWILQSWRR